MPRWAEVLEAAPDLAARCARRLLDPGLVLLGTLRADGSPRISPVEPLVVDGELELGMMPGSLKARDLLRDPRCVVHSVVVSKDGDEGDAKVYGRARDVRDPDARERYGVTLQAAIGWRPEGEFHLFAVDVAQLGWMRIEEGKMHLASWRPEDGVRSWVRSGSA